ncbi:MAG: symmetrical bis(5'-nucleosyl)-tetraphosphatase [Gammaproteobacteria bacterium]|nr:symmetrical bis(5'-nucleosyl)-tetraphosphatase [Gammaproteobacteria bacterium]
MAVYAIGDVQGCYDDLRRLVKKLKFDPDRDELWFVGDLVNRGPKSLKTLRYIKKLGDAATVVLGNHDLHLLAASVDPTRMDAAMREIIKADDADELLDWLRHRPLAVYRPKLNTLLVHAGVYRGWDPLQTIKLAREVEKTLRGKKYAKFLAGMYGSKPDDWSPDLEGLDRLRFITNCLTRIRYCYPDGRLDFEQKGPPGFQTKKLMPWFELKKRKTKSVRIVCGHWSSLGLVERPNLLMIDTGCVWGRKLTAARLDGPLRIVSVSAK